MANLRESRLSWPHSGFSGYDVRESRAGRRRERIECCQRGERASLATASP
jgi:hypothetical protein